MTARTSKLSFEELKQQILGQIDVLDEYKAIGLVVPENASIRESGWIQAHALGREDKKPSAAINVKTGYYKDSGGIGQTLSFWDAQVKFGPFRDWLEALNHFAAKVGVKLPEPPKESAKDQVEEVGRLNPIIIRGFLERYPEVRLSDLESAGCRLVRYPKKSPEPAYCIAWPFYGPQLTDAPHRGYVLQPIDGRELENSRGERHKRLAVGANSGLSNWHTLNLMSQKKMPVVIKVEGYSDMMALLSIIPESERDRVGVVTNACGSTEVALPNEVARAFEGIHVVVIHDSDKAGQIGADRWTAALKPYAKSVRNVQLFDEIKEKGGKDLRDWIRAGNTWEDLKKLIDAAVPIEEAKKVLSPAEEICKRLNIIVYGMCDENRRVQVFDSKGRKQIVNLGAFKEHDLRQLVGPEILAREVNFSDDEEPDPRRVSLRQIISAIAEVSHQRIITEENFFGDGIWQSGPDTLTIVQAGQVFDWNGKGKLEPSSPFREHAVYDTSGKKWYDADLLQSYLETQQRDPRQSAIALQEMINIFSRWDNHKYQDSAQLLAAMIPCTYLQTVWPERPLIGITGQSNTGKSYLRDALRGIFGDIAIAVSKPTEAGLRAVIRNSARAVLVDEFEECKNRSQILELLRTSLRGDQIVRSTANHQPFMAGIKHIVWINAKELGLTEAADVNRFIHFELMPLPHGHGNTLEIPPTDELRLLGTKLLAAALLNWKKAVGLTRVLRKTPFGNHDRRLVEIYAVPIAMLSTIFQESVDQAIERMWDALIDRSGDTIIEHDETILVNEILTADVRMESGKTFSVGQIIERVLEEDYDTTAEKEALERCGIKLLSDQVPLRTDVFFHPKTVAKKLLDKNAANKDLRLILARLEGAKTDARVRMNGMQVRGISVPYDILVSIGSPAETQPVFG